MAADFDYNLPTVGYGQYTATTCWFASYRMLYGWKNEDEWQIKDKLIRGGLKFDELMKRGLYFDEMPVSAGALGLMGWAGSYVKAIDIGMILHHLKYGPLWCSMDYQTYAHAVVVGGYSSSVKKLKIYNPWNGTDPGTVDIDWWTVAKFQKDIASDRFAMQAWP